MTMEDVVDPLFHVNVFAPLAERVAELPGHNVYAVALMATVIEPPTATVIF
jgi:hypothetical protein